MLLFRNAKAKVKELKYNKDLNYRIAIDVYDRVGDSTQVMSTLREVARTFNLNVANGVPKRKIEMAVVVHGGAISGILNEAAYQERYGVSNPNIQVIKMMKKEGENMMKVDKMKMETTKMVGGAEMYPTKNIIENAVNSKDHTTLVAAVKAADLVDVLSSEGPFTVFAPTNAAFNNLPKGTVETLLKSENKEQLQTILKYHVVSGKFNAVDVSKLIAEGNGKAKIKTVTGGTLTAWSKGDGVYITDENGASAKVTIMDVNQSNGVIHVVDAVLLPKAKM